MTTRPDRGTGPVPGVGPAPAPVASPARGPVESPATAPLPSPVAAPVAAAPVSGGSGAAPSASGGTGAGPSEATAAGAPSPDRQRLLLATDLSDASASATEEAFGLAGRLGASLLIVSVIDPGSLLLPGGRFRARVDQVREHREQQAQELVERGRAEGIEVSFLVWTGDPGDMIVEAAGSERVDMVLVGSHGRGAVGRFFLGSVSEHVVRHAPCPVLVVRPRETPAGS